MCTALDLSLSGTEKERKQVNIDILSINYFELIVNMDGMSYILEYEARKSVSLYNIQINVSFSVYSG